MKLLVILAILYGLWHFSQKKQARGMTAAEARDLLGISTHAGEAEIREAHRRLIGRVHPDAGGNQALASRVNAARDLLVRQLRKS
jgi:preprotein translocase subunit Sec63